MLKRLLMIFYLVLALSVVVFVATAAQPACDQVVSVGPWADDATFKATADESVCFRASWTAMTYGLAKAYTERVSIAYAFSGDGVAMTYGPSKGGWVYAGERLVSEAWSCPGKWASGDEMGDVFWWFLPVSDLNPGNYTLNFSTILQQPGRDPCDIDADGIRPNIYTGFSVELALVVYAPEEVGTLSGTVSEQVPDGSLGEPIPGIQWVTACREDVPVDEYGLSPFCGYSETDENGNYRIRYLMPGKYRLVIWVPQWVAEFYQDQTSYEEANLVVVDGGEEANGIDFDLVRAGSISGHVTDDSPAITPIPGIWVGSCRADVSEDDWGISPYCRGAETDEDGYYEIQGLAPGDYRVVIWDPAWVAEFYEDAPFYDDASLVPVEGGQETSSIDFDLTQAGFIAGRVTDDSPGMTPIPGIWVDACREDVPDEEWGSSPFCSGAETDGDGFYEIQTLAPGDYRVVIWEAPGCRGEFFDDKWPYAQADLVTVNPGDTTGGVDFQLSPDG
jgi:hypothetical protein